MCVTDVTVAIVVVIDIFCGYSGLCFSCCESGYLVLLLFLLSVLLLMLLFLLFLLCLFVFKLLLVWLWMMLLRT